MEEVKDVYRYLLHMGELYTERKHLLRQKKIFEELTHLNARSVISPSAAKYKKKKKEKAPDLLEMESLPVSERLYQLHQKNLQGATEESAEMEKEYSLKNNKMTFKRQSVPSLQLEEAKLLPYSCGSDMPLLQVVEKKTQSENERKFRRNKQGLCIREDVMNCVSETSSLCAPSEKCFDNLSVGYPFVEEHIPEKEKKKEKICRQVKVQRHRDAEESCIRRSSSDSFSFSSSTSLNSYRFIEKEIQSPPFSRHHRNSEFLVRAGDIGVMPSPLKKTSLYSLREKELNSILRSEKSVGNARYKKCSNECSCHPVRGHSFHFSVKQGVSSASEYEGENFQMEMAKKVHLDRENCLSLPSFCVVEKWPREGTDEVGERAGKNIEKTMHEEKVVVKESFSNDFSPTLCPASRRIVAQRRQKESTRGKVMRSPSTRLHADADARQRLSNLSFSKGRKQKAPPNCSSIVSPREPPRAIGKEGHHHSLLSFPLQISAESEKLWRRRVEEVQKRSGNLSNVNEAREVLWREADHRKEEQLQRKREENERKLLQECTFQPTLNRYSSLLQLQDEEECSPDSTANISVAERNVLWAANKARELEEKRNLRDHAELQECTFHPNAHLHKARK